MVNWLCFLDSQGHGIMPVCRQQWSGGQHPTPARGAWAYNLWRGFIFLTLIELLLHKVHLVVGVFSFRSSSRSRCEHDLDRSELSLFAFEYRWKEEYRHKPHEGFLNQCRHYYTTGSWRRRTRNVAAILYLGRF